MAWVWVWIVASGGLLYALGWWASAPMQGLLRWGFRGALAALLLGLMLPAEIINVIIAFLSQFIPGLGEISDQPGASFGMHFLLFLAVSTLLLIGRLDVASRPLLLALMALAFITEGLQWPIPDRYADWFDVGTNLIGVGLGMALRLLVLPLREHRHRLRL